MMDWGLSNLTYRTVVNTFTLVFLRVQLINMFVKLGTIDNNSRDDGDGGGKKPITKRVGERWTSGLSLSDFIHTNTPMTGKTGFWIL